ncbi:monoacylglycerol lipase ABHD12 isoform X1 [Anoplophora glabripennis]|uniref:monoacylglycerol lipase ABHD12 isoform X1 n=1 Tax=Anoplophora glabripennis TaxID=217634 RepID=UPI00087563A2|nr:monoacylglycerol lipase ABHD12 isoform X1 [Anoplophora glabripennis]
MLFEFLHHIFRYNDYYLVNDMEVDDVSFEPRKKSCCRKCLIIGAISLLCLLILGFLIIFVVLPLVFMNSISLQRALIFTHFDLPSSEKYFETYRLPGYLNKYVTVKDLDGRTNVTLGVWQMLPVLLAYESLHNPEFDYKEALFNSNYSVLIYFHGTGESRSDSSRKFQLLRYYFHVIAFDYRSYADSTQGILSEKAVVSDCVQLYQWLRNRTNSPIYIWGHSLGAALATETEVALRNLNYSPKGLVLESAFTNLRDEMYVHPYVKIFAWLPWFAGTILNPLRDNGFIFDTDTRIRKVSCPVMILHAEDDSIVPYKFGRELYKIASNRSVDAANTTFYHQFGKDLGYNHYFIYQDPYVKYFIMDFIVVAEKNESRTVDSP